MAKKLYVGNMSYDTTEDSLRALFASVGEVVSVNIITDRGSGRSKGFGFVEMATEAEAQKAISQLNSSTLNDRQISVAEARPQRPRDDRGGGGGGGGGRRRRTY
jgi:cold-inducible RNA-binding protein